MEKEKLIYLGAGINSRVLGISLSAIFLVFLVLFIYSFILTVFLPGRSLDLDMGPFKFRSGSITCVDNGSQSFPRQKQFERYNATKKLEDLPSGCTFSENKMASSSLLAILIFVSFLLLTLFGMCNKITAKGKELLLYNGNVLILRKRKMEIDNLSQVRIFSIPKRAFSCLWTYKIICLEFSSEAGKILFETNQGISDTKNKMDKIFLDVITKRLLRIAPTVKIINEA